MNNNDNRKKSSLIFGFYNPNSTTNDQHGVIVPERNGAILVPLGGTPAAEAVGGRTKIVATEASASDAIL